MNLKEAFRFQNRLTAFLDETRAILGNEANVTREKITYLRGKVDPGAQDETVLVSPETEYFEQMTEMVRFMVWLLEEKGRLFSAIRRAKNALDVDMDAEVSLNAERQTVARTLRRMNDLRASEKTVSGGGTGYRFNAEGNQVAYRCDVKRVTSVNFDRNVVRRALMRLDKLSDEASAKLDLCLVTSKVDYVPPFDVNLSFREVFERFAETAGA